MVVGVMPLQTLTLGWRRCRFILLVFVDVMLLQTLTLRCGVMLLQTLTLG